MSGFECLQCERLTPLRKTMSPNCKPCPQLRLTRSLDASTIGSSFFTHLSHTRDRRLASEIPLKLSILVDVDRLTSFDSVRRRCAEALRNRLVRGIESSSSKRTLRTLGNIAISSSHSTGPCLRSVTVHCLLNACQSSTTCSLEKTRLLVASTKTDRPAPTLAPQCLHSQVIVYNKRIFFLEDEELCC